MCDKEREKEKGDNTGDTEEIINNDYGSERKG